MTAQTSIFIAFMIYLIAMLLVGLYYMNASSNIADYLLGGRKLNKWVVSLSTQASDMSGWLLMGLPGLAYLTGSAEPLWVAIGLAAGTYLNWRFIAKRLRHYTVVAGDSLTISDFFENRFADRTRLLRLSSALFIVVFFSLYSAAGFIAGGKLFNSVFGIDYHYAVLISAGVLVAYTFLGGYLAVCWTDLIQGIIMLVAAIAVPVAGIIYAGGFGPVSERITAMGPGALSLFSSADGTRLSALTIISNAAWGLGYFGMPHLLVRFMSIKKPEELKDARRIAMIWVIISLFCAVAIGLVGRAITASAPLVGPDSEKVFLVMSREIFPAFMAGVVMSAVLAAIMSTADSQLLVASSAISEDFYKTVFRGPRSARKSMFIGRISVLVIAIAAFIFALNPNSSIFKVVSFAWSGLGATFGPVIILSLFWRRMTGSGALAGIVAGGVTVLVWHNLAHFGGIFKLYEIVPGFAASVLAIIITSLAGKAPSGTITRQFNEVVKLSR